MKPIGIYQVTVCSSKTINSGTPFLRDLGAIQGLELELGHDSPLATFSSYGNIDSFRQGELFRELFEKPKKKSIEEIIASLRSLES